MYIYIYIYTGKVFCFVDSPVGISVFDSPVGSSFFDSPVGRHHKRFVIVGDLNTEIVVSRRYQY